MNLSHKVSLGILALIGILSIGAAGYALYLNNNISMSASVNGVVTPVPTGSQQYTLTLSATDPKTNGMAIATATGSKYAFFAEADAYLDSSYPGDVLNLKWSTNPTHWPNASTNSQDHTCTASGKGFSESTVPSESTDITTGSAAAKNLTYTLPTPIPAAGIDFIITCKKYSSGTDPIITRKVLIIVKPRPAIPTPTPTPPVAD